MTIDLIKNIEAPDRRNIKNPEPRPKFTATIKKQSVVKMGLHILISFLGTTPADLVRFRVCGEAMGLRSW